MAAGKLYKLLLVVLLLAGQGGCKDADRQASSQQRQVLTGKLLLSNPQPGGAPIPLRGIAYQTGSTAKTAAAGLFRYAGANTVTFNLFNTRIGPIPAKAILTETDLAIALCRKASQPVPCRYATAINLRRLLLSTDNDLDTTNGIVIPTRYAKTPPASLDSTIDSFELALGRWLNKTGRQAVAVFSPSLGINLEAPQAEADEVGGQPLPFADLYRIARPFWEYSCSAIQYDKQGWPKQIPASCDTEINPVFKTPTYATTLLLRYLPAGAIPTGKYVVLYEGFGQLDYSGIGSKLVGESSQGRDIVSITPESIQARAGAGLRLQVKDIDPANPVRNIRIVMPGGTCAGNPFVRAEKPADCKRGHYQSFENRLANNRNAIIFNPDYLRFLKDFSEVRTMNFMEASPRNPCFIYSGDAYQTCLTQPLEWSMRAKLSDASWGGSARTPLLERYARGAPLEVVVELANQLNRSPWFNIPHNASDQYVRQYARYVRDHLKPGLKVHLEYTNEAWNGIFWAAYYVREKGKDLDTNPYRAGYKYYSTRAVEIFNIWHDVFGGRQRLVRILGTYHPDEWMSRNMLGYNGNYQFVDVLASAPYFQGCWDRSSNSACQNEEAIPLLTKDARSVTDLFDIIDNPANPYGMHAAFYWMEKQAKVAEEFGLGFYAYEGGQHLTVNWYDLDTSNSDLQRVLQLMQAANRDLRMGGRYSQLLNGWKERGGQLFALYTLPQSWHKFGAFGIKEHLNQSRFDAPKYDMSMQFQEMLQGCWWEGCQ